MFTNIFFLFSLINNRFFYQLIDSEKINYPASDPVLTMASALVTKHNTKIRVDFLLFFLFSAIILQQ